MPLEIREMVIKTSVNTGLSALNSNTHSDETRLENFDQAAIIAACVQQVLEILKEQAER